MLQRALSFKCQLVSFPNLLFEVHRRPMAESCLSLEHEQRMVHSATVHQGCLHVARIALMELPPEASAAPPHSSPETGKCLPWRNGCTVEPGALPCPCICESALQLKMKQFKSNRCTGARRCLVPTSKCLSRFAHTDPQNLRARSLCKLFSQLHQAPSGRSRGPKAGSALRTGFLRTDCRLVKCPLESDCGAFVPATVSLVTFPRPGPEERSFNGAHNTF